MLRVVDIACLVDQQHRDVVVDPVGAPQPGVVQKTIDEGQRSAVGGTHEDVEEFLIKHRDRYWLGGVMVKPPVLPGLFGLG
jgi:hypothetical protein